MGRFLPFALVAAAAVVATLAVNFLLVGYAQDRDDPVGKLSPRALVTQTETGRTGSAARTTTSPTTTESTTEADEDDGDSSGRGRGRGRGRGGDDDD